MPTPLLALLALSTLIFALIELRWRRLAEPTAAQRARRGLALALFPLVTLLCHLCVNVIIYGDDTLGGANQLALLGGAVIAVGCGALQGITFAETLKAIRRNLDDAMGAILTLLLIGAISGAWLLSGVVPTMVYYGVQLISPGAFLVTACLLCALTSLASGSSWSTVATVGLALLAVGRALGFSDPVCAGAIISGAYFGDKLSPLSDTTNLAPAMAGGELFAHIRAMLWTSGPAMVLTLIIFSLFETPEAGATGSLEGFLGALDAELWIHPVLFALPLFTVALLIRGLAPLPTLALSALVSALVALWAQPSLVASVAAQAGVEGAPGFIAITEALTRKISVPIDHEALGSLLSAKGMQGMLGTIWLITCAMCFGGAMEASGGLQRISGALLSFVRGRRGLVAATGTSCVFFNLTASDQYLSIVVPGRMFREAYEREGLAPEALSRTLEDTGTVTSVLVPWNTCGATQAGVLSVATLSYLPYAVFCYLSPLITLLFALLQWRQPLQRTPISSARPSSAPPEALSAAEMSSGTSSEASS